MKNKELQVREKEFDQIQFLEDINNSTKLSEKVRVISKALNDEALHTKNMQEEMKKKGLRATKGTDYDYIPIEIVEEGLRQVFLRQVDFEIRSDKRELNSYVVVARINYLDMASGQMRFIDGIGAKAMQQDKNSHISEFNNTMKSNALELAVGMAYSRAIKNAAKRLGKRFGANLNRDEEIESVQMFKRDNEQQVLFRLQSLFIEKAARLNGEAIARIKEIIEEKEVNSYQKAIKDLEAM